MRSAGPNAFFQPRDFQGLVAPFFDNLATRHSYPIQDGQITIKTVRAILERLCFVTYKYP